MGSVGLAVVGIVSLVLAYRFYGRFLATKIFSILPDRPTPAHELEDGIDYLPTNKFVLFGHHFASIAGTGPIVGPAIAVIYGWLPALLWILVGSIFLGGVHDFGALVVSLRHQGRSIGDLADQLVGPRARMLFLLVAFFLLILVLAVFALVIAALFINNPKAVFPSFALIVVAMILGMLIYRSPIGLVPATIIGLALMFGSIWFGLGHPLGAGITENGWVLILLAYAFVASVLPVWFLLQPRDYINSFGLYLGLGLMYVGLFVLRPAMAAPAVQAHPEGAPPMLPFLFILVACGAISGFHSLVSSGTTVKQVNSEKDTKFIGYGSMLVEGALALVVLLACTAGLGSPESWHARYASWTAASGLQAKLGAFVQGGGAFLAALGIPSTVGETLVSVTVVAFAMTSLDSATRLTRFIVSELGAKAGASFTKNRFIASGIAVGCALALVLIPLGEKSTGMVLWPVFATTNQILACLALLIVSVYLRRQGKPIIYTLLPVLFMLIITSWAMGLNLVSWTGSGVWILGVAGTIIFIAQWWFILEGLQALARRTETEAANN